MLSFSLVPLKAGDYPEVSRIFVETFADDIHTVFKRHGDVSWLRTDPASIQNQRQGFVKGLQNPKRISVKAIDEKGNFLGSIGIVYNGFTEKELAQLTIPRVLPEPDLESKKIVETTSQLENTQINEEKKRAIKVVNDLEACEQQDWRVWEKILMPEGSKSVGITGVSVDPAYQGHGIGTALVSWATKKAEEVGLSIWVHASEAGFRTFKKCGFEEIGRLEVDLDEWAGKADIPVPEGKEKWGVYVCRWMKKEKV